MAATRIRAVHRVGAFAALVLLATLSLVLGTTLHWPWGDVAISLAIASVKTWLVLWLFMDLSDQPFRARLAIAVAVLLLVLLVGLTAADVATRMATVRGPTPTADEAFFRR
ncbi:MAG TPA: cytochrome C oxidase subunit IV family protein [Polyangia bacterium]